MVLMHIAAKEFTSKESFSQSPEPVFAADVIT